MRIAICGSHRVGKTTLAEMLAESLAGCELVPEPYAVMEEEGHEFNEMPSIDDFEAMLERAIELLATDERDVVFDRCPLDMLAYLMTHRDAALFDVEAWRPRIQASVSTLDLIVFVPIEDADVIAVPRAEARLRADVDGVLAELVAESGIEVVSVSGSVDARMRSAMATLRARALR